MFKLKITQLDNGKEVFLVTPEFPVSKEIRTVSGKEISDLALSILKSKKYLTIVDTHYEVLEFKIPTVSQLQQDLQDWYKVASYKGERFGQYIYNLYGYEVEGSYNAVSAIVAYELLFNGITSSLDELLECGK